jgi:DNA (cytosine-5)-methyltransferase 1
MKYLSVCSGMEAASVAWDPLGWKPVGFSEIEPFPCAILKHRFPNTPNYGSLTEYKSWPVEPGSVDLLVGGTPCQSFSVAGLRKGLADPRGDLALTFLGLADRIKPRWIIWENVPGALSSNGGRDFGAFVGALVELGYGFSYRVLNAVHFGVAQRRRRIFVVAHLGDWRPAAEVLFEPQSLHGDSSPGRKTSKGNSADLGGGLETDSPIILDRASFNQGINAQYDPQIEVTETCPTVISKGPHAVQPQCVTGDITHCLTKRFDSSEDGTGRGLPIVPQSLRVRRLTPIECERLQGFPDNWSRIPWKGKPEDECPDGPRYTACGNSMAVPVMRWIGSRIDMYEKTKPDRRDEETQNW